MNFFRKPVKPTDADDDKLLTLYRESGDLLHLGKLYEKQMPLVYGVCLKYLKDEEQAKDAVMGIFEELTVKVKQHDIKQFKSWLYVLSRNYCLMQLRAGKKMEVINLDDVMEFSLILHPDDNNREAAMQALEKCMEKLPLNQKQTVSLFYLNEKCYKEITELTGFTLNEVKSFIQNGKRNLKICLEKNSE
ncbi:RNA polymerase sigma factor [Mucilaginibacter flavidus]|uniref:RNA polymerase sigma factor n=1 Tax=Mucilaginibacter flavidus TaxID=2949309 RepID=UPI002092D75A|nr:sigma-70 family RNA polymerase sigma factor [Mucilaginibacter flavidus]MCO5950637.1 sigma-70 family RNA polymerase sigma factor [Mucilaginibacter flavidus]